MHVNAFLASFFMSEELGRTNVVKKMYTDSIVNLVRYYHEKEQDR